jgi:predicted dehydrogenase
MPKSRNRSRKRTRIAVAGAGLIGRAHIAALRASPSCELSAVVDPSPAAGARFSSLDELLRHDRPAGVILATPNPLHVEQALQCIDAGLPILLEKPIAPTVEGAEKIVRESERRKVPVLIGHHRAHSPIMARAKEIVDSGRLGRLVAVTGSAMFLKPDHYFAEGPWRRGPGGGPILINLIHEIHNLRMLCGEIAEVQAFASSAVRGFPVEDTVAIGFRFRNGVLGTFMLSDTAASARSWEQTSGENKAYPRYRDEDCYVIAGTNGSLAIPTMRLKAYARAADRSWWKPFRLSRAKVKPRDPIRRQLEHFGAVIRGEAEPLVSACDGLANLRVTEAVVAAAKSGKAVVLA